MVVGRESLDASLYPFTPRVLVVDDHDDSRDMYATFLTHVGGCRVSEAARGGDVLPLLQRDLHDVMLLDLVLPDVDGFDILRSVRQTPVLADLKVMVVSALAPLSDVQRQRLREGRPDALLTKPCSLEVMLSELRVLTARGRDLRNQAAAERARTRSLFQRARELHRQSASLQRIARRLSGGDA